MQEFLANYGNLLLKGLIDTIYMVTLSVIGSYVLGIPMGIALYVTQEGNICENICFNRIFSWIVNILRSVPFIILMIAIMPFTRLIVGKAIGATAAIVPLIVGCAPFVARMIESSLSEIDKGVIEACLCMGATPWEIITKVLIKESLPSVIRGVSITAITLVGYSAIAGALGAGGLGDIAIRYGHHRKVYSVMYVALIMVILLVSIIQTIFNSLAKKYTR
ncbi:MAG: methionine ABC transporter permease [Oscillospiraceae bacterium]